MIARVCRVHYEHQWNSNWYVLDIKLQLSTDHQVHISYCFIGAHNEHGKLERSFHKLKSIINVPHQQPLTIKGVIGNSESVNDPSHNHLKLGRNNERSSVKPIELVDEKCKIFNSWFSRICFCHTNQYGKVFMLNLVSMVWLVLIMFVVMWIILGKCFVRYISFYTKSYFMEKLIEKHFKNLINFLSSWGECKKIIIYFNLYII